MKIEKLTVEELKELIEAIDRKGTEEFHELYDRPDARSPENWDWANKVSNRGLAYDKIIKGLQYFIREAEKEQQAKKKTRKRSA